MFHTVYFNSLDFFQFVALERPVHGRLLSEYFAGEYA